MQNEPIDSASSLEARELAERARTFRRLLMAGAAVLAVALAVSIATQPADLAAHFPYASMLVLHVAMLALSPRVPLHVAVALHAAIYSALVMTTMLLYGGVRSPAGFVLPPVVLLVGLTWSGRAAIGVAVAIAAATLTMVFLEQSGAIGIPVSRPSPLQMGIVVTGTLVITAVLVFVALDVIHRSRAELKEKERERLELEERLLQSRRLESVGRLAAGVAHDFNNVLTVIFANASALEAHADPAVRASGKATLDSAQRAATLTRQLLAFGRRQVLEPQLLDVNPLMRDLDVLLSRFVGEHVRLKLELAPEPMRVLADRTQIEQVLLNLVTNARDALPDGGEVVLRTAGGNGTVELSVVDNGIGMTPEVLQHAFEPFFTTKERGTGLGLATVRSIVEQLNGAVEVASKPGRGTTITVRLPEAQGTEKAPALPQPRRGGGAAANLLVVDDDDDVRHATALILASAGHSVREAATSAEALEALVAPGGTPELALLDVVMPGTSGPRLAARLRELQPGLRILFMSGYPEDHISVRGVLADGVQVITKPFEPQALLERIRGALAAESLGAIPDTR